MARVTPIERSQIKTVIIEAHKPDTTFRTNAEVKSRCHRQGIPIEMIILIIRSLVWKARDRQAYQWFRQHYEQGISLNELARREGICRNSHNIITRRLDAMLDEAVDRTGNYMANILLTLYDEFLKCGGTYGT